MSFKKIYYALEDKYYAFVEKTGLYKITDKIDKFMPSFIFFILLIIMIIASLFLLIPAQKGDGDFSVYFTIKGEGGTLIDNAPVEVVCSNEVYNLYTDEFGNTDKVYTSRNQSCSVTVDGVPGYLTLNQSLVVDEVNQNKIYFLDEEDSAELVNYSFSVVDDSTGQGVSSGTVNFSCTNEGAIAPDAVDFIAGTVNVEAAENCDLQATIVASNYQTLYSIPINAGTPTLEMNSSEANFSGTYDVDVYTKDNSNQAVQNMKVTAYNQGIPVKSCITNTGGYCKIESLDEGNYELKATDQRAMPEYTTANQSIFVNADITQTINLNKEVQGYIKVEVLDHTGDPLEDALVKLKIVDQEMNSGYTNQEGTKLFAITNNSSNYRVVVDVEGYMIASKLVTPVSQVPSEPTITIELEQVDGSTYKPLHLQVLDEEGKGYSHAQVVLFDSETGFLTDFSARTSNYEGEVTFIIPSGNYYAKAIKGSSTGVSEDFYFDARVSDTMDTIVIPMAISKGYLEVKVVDTDGEPIQNAKVDVFDKFDGENPIESDLTDALGVITKEVDADQKVYVKVSDPLGNKGVTQSTYVYVHPEQTSNLEVTLYNEKSSSSKAELVFDGLYRSEKRMNTGLKAGQEYEARFTLFVPSNRSGDRRFKHVGALLSVGSNVLLENESLYIKDIDVGGDPSILSVKKYTKYENDQDFLDVDNIDNETLDNAKWVSVIFDESGYTYNTAYNIKAIVKVKDSAVFGEDLRFNYIGYSYNRNNEYEIKSRDGEIEVDEITQIILDETRFSIGSETACDDLFCFNMDITDLENDLRQSVISEYTAAPEIEYTADFTLINNSEENTFRNARIQIKNLDEGLEFTNIHLQEHTGNTININPGAREYSFDEELDSLDAKRSLTGEISFKPVLKGDRHLLINFISDQEVIFSRNITLHVLSDKTFEVDITPELLPAYKPNLNLQVEVNDKDSGFAVNDDVYVTIKDKYLNDIGTPKLVGINGEVSVPVINALAEDDKIYVYVQAPEYETYVQEVGVTDKIFNINPGNLGVSLNVETNESKDVLFNISNLIENDLKVKSISFKGDRDNVKYIDAVKINNLLESYTDTVIDGIDSDDVTGNYDTSKDFTVNFSLNRRSEEIYEVQNIKAYLVVVMQDAYNEELTWSVDVPVSITIGFNGMLDDSTCIVTSSTNWEEVVLNKPVENQFILDNACTINSNPVPLRNGLQAKVEFSSNPLGRFTVSVGNRFVELSSGYFKTIFDSVDAEKSYPVVVRYEPIGRFSGSVEGKIIFRSLNDTSSGQQELLSEFNFNLDVLSLQDCYVLSKNILEIKDNTNADSLTIENKGCGKATNYRFSCDDCQGLIVEPRDNIRVDATGSSGDIVVKSIGAMPGAYILHLYSSVEGQRGSDRHVGEVKVNVRPVGECIDLDRYEFDLYRSTISENTGRELATTSYDTANIINKCYKQDVRVEGKVENTSRIAAAFGAGFRDALGVGAGSWSFKKLFGSDGIVSGWFDDDEEQTNPCKDVTCDDGNVCQDGECVVQQPQEPIPECDSDNDCENSTCNSEGVCVAEENPEEE